MTEYIKKSMNSEFFDTWTEQSAYVLGYIWSDGCLHTNKGHSHVNISSNDWEVIEKLKRVMDLTCRNHMNGPKNMFITFSDKRVIARLRQLGLIERKSKTVTFPDIPDEYVRHFIRGYFDGNGHFTYERHKGEKRRIVSGFASGSESMATSLSEKLHEAGLRLCPVKYRDRSTDPEHGNYYYIRYYTIDTRKLYAYMYEDATIYMDRKKEYYDNIVGGGRT